MNYWKKILKWVTAVITTLAERGYPFRGSDEKFDSSNNGNYLVLLKLTAKFDPFLRDHIIKYGNTGKGNPSYVSKTICEEFINILGQNVQRRIIEEVISDH